MKKQLQNFDREHASRKLQLAMGRHKKSRTEFGGSGYVSFNGKKLDTIFNTPILPVPKVFDLVKTKYDQDFHEFFQDFEALVSERKHLYLSFANTTVARLPIFLILYSILDKYPCKISILWSRKSRLVNKMITNAGSFKSISKRNSALTDPEYRQIPVISGSNEVFQTFPDDLVDAIANKYYDGAMPPNIESRISQAIIETLENVGRHAYPNESKDFNKKWWLVCSLGYASNIDEEYMYLAIYDSGRGIPLSFGDSKVFQNRVKSHYPEEYAKLLHGETKQTTKSNAITKLVKTAASIVYPLRETIGDSGMIHASMMHDMTRLNDDNHGQGSVSIKDVITDDEDSCLIILSNKGCYQYNKGADNEHERLELHNELSGTLLQWSIKLDELC